MVIVWMFGIPDIFLEVYSPYFLGPWKDYFFYPDTAFFVSDTRHHPQKWAALSWALTFPPLYSIDFMGIKGAFNEFNIS